MGWVMLVESVHVWCESVSRPGLEKFTLNLPLRGFALWLCHVACAASECATQVVHSHIHIYIYNIHINMHIS